MAFFTIPYRILFHDTMAYGSHHHMTNFKFQNFVRETLLFESKVDGRDVWQEQLKNIVMLTREAYSLNLAPVNLGEKVAILLTYEDPGRSSVKLCFRVIKEDGTPVSCGYQNIVMIHKDTRELVQAPELMLQYLNAESATNLLEPLQNPGFVDRLKMSVPLLKDLFTNDIIRIGIHVANSVADQHHPKIINTALESWLPGMDGPSLNDTYSLKPVDGERAIVFAFPGQGGYDIQLLQELYAILPNQRHYFEHADQVSKKMLGHSFLELISSKSLEQHDRLLAAHPDLSQVGIFLAEVLIANELIKRGLKPDLLLGHSFGEFAALAISGVFSIEEGIEIVCHRVLALASITSKGMMAAISCDLTTTESLLYQEKADRVQIAIRNHSKQTILSGSRKDLEALIPVLQKSGITLTFLQSNYPFHSTLLKQAVPRFKKALETYNFKDPQYPVLHGTENRLWTKDLLIPQSLADDLIKPLDFISVIRTLYKNNYRQFVETGPGNIVTKIIGRTLNDKSDTYMQSSAPANLGLQKGIELLQLHFPNLEPINKEDTPEPSDQSINRVPIAIVSMGCYLPGAKDADAYYQQIINGESGIVDLAELNPSMHRDFSSNPIGVRDRNIVSDKTYSLLNGTITDISYPVWLLSHYYDRVEYEALTRGQKFLAISLAQCLRNLHSALPESDKPIPCIIGSTADGSAEYDEALFADQLYFYLDQLEESDLVKEEYGNILEEILGYCKGNSASLTQHNIYQKVVNHMLRQFCPTFIIDSACSSSLYSVNLGMRSLQNHESDLVIAGGIFAPGPANNTLFAQFGGLSTNGSRPFDSNADGVVFSDGAGLLLLKRLPDALDSGDKIIAVIRGMGLSSDGKSPSVNVPQANGQQIAVEKAYEQSGIDPGTIQYIEAHATSTPVGDAEEFKALSRIFNKSFDNLERIEIASVKSLIGHTGWASGVASIIKLCKAFEFQMIPKQYNFESPNPKIDLAGSPFSIAGECRQWPKNRRGFPRRAGINGFGFGGTNAHLILEEFSESYHKNLCKNFDEVRPAKNSLAVIGICSLFPSTNGFASDQPGDIRHFRLEEAYLPAKKILLPDVVDHMDITQFIGPIAVEKLLQQIGDPDLDLKKEIGVVLGLEGKTSRGKLANERIFLARFKRLLEEHANNQEMNAASIQRITQLLINRIVTYSLPSGPYTLPGLMPNVSSGRINNLYHFQGPNVVVDMGYNSFFQSLWIADQFLRNGDCKIVFVGAINTFREDDTERDAALFIGLCLSETAGEIGRKPLGKCDIRLSDKKLNVFGDGQLVNYKLKGSDGLSEVYDAVKSGGRTVIPNRANTQFLELELPEVFTKIQKTDSPETTTGSIQGTHEYISDTPILNFTPVRTNAPPREAADSLLGRKILFVSDQPEWIGKIYSSGLLDVLDCKILCPSGKSFSGSVEINLNSESGIQESLQNLSKFEVDTIILLSAFDGKRVDDLLVQSSKDYFALADLAFVLCQHYFDALKEKRMSIYGLCLGAFFREELHPGTGIFGGFLKSLVRELPQVTCKIVYTDENNLLKALNFLEIEMSQVGPLTETCYVNNNREIFQLKSSELLTGDNSTQIGQNSVILATGGGRGVTAVLVESLVKSPGCTVIGLGRTDPESAPLYVRDMDEQAFKDYETLFYQEELAKKDGRTIKDLRQKYRSWQAVNELCQNIKRMRDLPGYFHYRIGDLNNAAAVKELVRECISEFGKIDWVIHGAGVQVSGLIQKRTLADFRNVIGTKLISLRNIYVACQVCQPDHDVNFHLLTSAFSYLGNDGQPDYGAANETMNRIAAAMRQFKPTVHWSSIAWLGWAGIGMTKGSEFAALAARRKLRGITRKEGQQFFSDLLGDAPAAAINIQLAAGEIDFYQPDILSEIRSPKTNGETAKFQNTRRLYQSEKVILIDLKNAPFLQEHMVNEVPTFPGAFFISLAAEIAHEMRPSLKVIAFENTRFIKFSKVFPGKNMEIKIRAKIIEESDADCLIQVKFLSDFSHESGIILQKEILKNEIFVRMAEQIPEPPEAFDPIKGRGLRHVDPYTLIGSPLRLTGKFIAMDDIVVDAKKRQAVYQLKENDYKMEGFSYLIPGMIMIDAFWRFGTIHELEPGVMAVYVPERCEAMKIYFDLTDFANPALRGQFRFLGYNPAEEGDFLRIGPIQTCDSTGKVRLVVEQGICRKFGVVGVPLMAEK